VTVFFNARDRALNGVAPADLAHVARITATVVAVTVLAKGFMIISLFREEMTDN
jgi:hypothetical protein